MLSTVPIGAILDWWIPVGSKVAPPANFAICDGSKISDPDSPFNGFNTPNLVQRFTYGATNIGEIGNTGGSSTANVSITSQLPSSTGNIPGAAPAAGAPGPTVRRTWVTVLLWVLGVPAVALWPASR